MILTRPLMAGEQPLLGSRASYGLRISGQKFLQPLPFTQSLPPRSQCGRADHPRAHVSAISSATYAVRIDAV
jgi:hypothetical protein